MIPSPRLGFLRSDFLANHLRNTDNLTRTNKRQNTYQLKLINTKSGPNKQQHNENYTKTVYRARFSCLLHLARKWSGSIVTTREPALRNINNNNNTNICKAHIVRIRAESEAPQVSARNVQHWMHESRKHSDATIANWTQTKASVIISVPIVRKNFPIFRLIVKHQVANRLLLLSFVPEQHHFLYLLIFHTTWMAHTLPPDSHSTNPHLHTRRTHRSASGAEQEADGKPSSPRIWSEWVSRV